MAQETKNREIKGRELVAAHAVLLYRNLDDEFLSCERCVLRKMCAKHGRFIVNEILTTLGISCTLDDRGYIS